MTAASQSTAAAGTTIVKALDCAVATAAGVVLGLALAYFCATRRWR